MTAKSQDGTCQVYSWDIIVFSLEQLTCAIAQVALTLTEVMKSSIGLLRL